MENRFEHTPPEEKQGAYTPPPPVSAPQSLSIDATAPPARQSVLPQLPQDLDLCQRVRDKLPYLLENDGEITPHLAKAIYGHLSVCKSCSADFDESQRVVACLDAMPPVELPMDFAGIIHRRIQMNDVPINPLPLVSGMEAVPTRSLRVGGVPVELVVTGRQQSGTQAQLRSTSATVGRQTTQLQSVSTLQRLTLGSICAAVMGYFVSCNWGRTMLGQNVEVARTWINQIVEAFKGIPLIGHLFVLVFAAMTEMGSLLGETYRTIGDMAVRGLAMDIALCVAAYYFLVARRQRNHIRRV